MERLRTPFLIVAIALSFIVVLIETGTALPGVLRSVASPINSFQQLPPDVSSGLAQLNSDQRNTLDMLSTQNRPPGLSIPALALLDSIVLFTLILVGSALLIPERLQGRVQGIATLIFSLVLIGIALVQIFVVVGLLILMISLLLSVPFGTIVYLIIYGSFNRGGADIALSLLMFLKLVFAASLLIAQQRFLQSKGLVLLIVTSLLCNVIVSILLGLVPGILVSITDAIAAIIVGIIAVIWAIILLIGSIISIIKILRIDRALPAIQVVK
jgi:hypothetical protein